MVLSNKIHLVIVLATFSVHLNAFLRLVSKEIKIKCVTTSLDL